uniref:Uncharacterized protein n=1 Tax=Globisporangium ultimum (strain ATCC 200006 / CBS 805.95 / DAOM BR144) TaxID=431595 RepID=K3X5B8_GLOUD
MTPAEDIVVASFISRSTDPAQRSTRQQQTNGRFDDSVLRGTAAFQLTGQLPPSPASGGDDNDRSDRGSDESTFDIGLSFVSNDSSAMYQAPPSEGSSSSLSSNAWHTAAGAGAPSNVTSEQLSFGESDVGDFRSTGGVPSMFSDADSLELRSTTNTNPQRRSDSAFNMFMKPSFDEIRLSSGVYSSDAVPRPSGASDVRPSSNTDIVSSSFDDGDSSGDEILDEANDFSIVDATAINPLAMSRVSELSEGSL